MRSSVPDHCRAYALSDPGDQDYLLDCDHDHEDRCDRCSQLASVVAEIKETLEASNCSNDTKDELNFVIVQSKQNINAWKSHLLRSGNQDECRLDILKQLDETSVLIVLDWAMKYLPRKFRESQTNWFAKRGIPWHIAVALRRGTDSQMEMMTFVHIFDSCNQDSRTVLAILNDVFYRLKGVMPQLQSVYLRQDNAGCYHCSLSIVTARQVAEVNGLRLARMDFSDAQGGKGLCDRKAATIKSHIAVYLNSGHDIETASQILEAISSFDGVAGVQAMICSPPTSPLRTSIKWEGVSFISNIQHDEECLRVWKAYKIGPGKLVPYSKFNCPSELPSLSSSSDNSIKVNFVPIKPRRIKKPTADLKDDQNDGKDDDDNDIDDDCDNDDDDDDDHGESVGHDSDKPKDALFSCPEEGCTKSYQRYSSLLNHIECGLHKRSLECETLYDRAIMGYASRLEQGATAIPELGLGKEVRITAYSAPSLPMGWALKCSRARGARFSTKQKEYLSAKFQIGERTGLKADPASVATAMRKAKDVNGERLFDSTEFLTAQQFASFFSRLAAKKTTDEDTEDDDEDEDHTAHLQRENHLQEMRDNIVTSMSIQNAHPIVYDSFNICELVQKSKLASFSIQLLQEICSSFGLDISNIKIKRKQPYINILRELVKGCKCQLGTVK